MNAQSRIRRKALGGEILYLINKHPFSARIIGLILLWLPYLIVFFPGVFMYDSTWELFQSQGSGALTMGRVNDTFTDASFSDHKPIFHTFVIGLLFNFGKLLGSQTLGIFLITLVQFIALAVSFSFMLFAISKYTNRTVSIVCFLFLGLFPLFPMYAVSIFNDCLAAAAFIPWSIFFFEWICKDKLSRNQFILMIVFGTLSALLKKPNAYIIFLCCIFLIIRNRKLISKILLQAITPLLIVCLLMPTIVYPILNVESGDKGEMIGTALQQTVAYITKHPDKLTSEDEAAINKIIALDGALEDYHPETFDYAKYYYLDQESTAELIDYFAVWAKEGIADPLCFIQAVWNIQNPWIIPTQQIDFYTIQYEDMRNAVNNSNYSYSLGKTQVVADELNYTAPASLKQLRNSAIQTLNNDAKSPILSFVLSIALYTTIIPALAVVVSLIRKKQRYVSLFACLPLFVAYAVLFISPIVLCRYALPVISLIPVLLSVTFSKVQRDL